MSDASARAPVVPRRRMPPRAPALELNAAHRVQVGMITFLCSEAAFFGTLIVAYITYIGQSDSGPQPAEVLQLPLVIAATVCLLISSVTVHMASTALHAGQIAKFRVLLAITVLLGAAFLLATAVEWHRLIYIDGLTISRNLFGSTYFTLVGFHALHVTIGVGLLKTMFLLSLFGVVSRTRTVAFESVSWYWHFVDTVWILVFVLVYLLGR